MSNLLYPHFHHPIALCGDLYDVFMKVKHDKHTVIITGPNRTTGIEKF